MPYSEYSYVPEQPLMQSYVPFPFQEMATIGAMKEKREADIWKGLDIKEKDVRPVDVPTKKRLFDALYSEVEGSVQRHGDIVSAYKTGDVQRSLRKYTRSPWHDYSKDLYEQYKAARTEERDIIASGKQPIYFNRDIFDKPLTLDPDTEEPNVIRSYDIQAPADYGAAVDKISSDLQAGTIEKYGLGELGTKAEGYYKGMNITFLSSDQIEKYSTDPFVINAFRQTSEGQQYVRALTELGYDPATRKQREVPYTNDEANMAISALFYGRTIDKKIYKEDPEHRTIPEEDETTGVTDAGFSMFGRVNNPEFKQVELGDPSVITPLTTKSTDYKRVGNEYIYTGTVGVRGLPSKISMADYEKIKQKERIEKLGEDETFQIESLVHEKDDESKSLYPGLQDIINANPRKMDVDNTIYNKKITELYNEYNKANSTLTVGNIDYSSDIIKSEQIRNAVDNQILGNITSVQGEPKRLTGGRIDVLPITVTGEEGNMVKYSSGKAAVEAGALTEEEITTAQSTGFTEPNALISSGINYVTTGDKRFQVLDYNKADKARKEPLKILEAAISRRKPASIFIPYPNDKGQVIAVLQPDLTGKWMLQEDGYIHFEGYYPVLEYYDYNPTTNKPTKKLGEEYYELFKRRQLLSMPNILTK